MRRANDLPTFDSAMSLVNSKVPEQRERGLLQLERGEFLQPDSMKVCVCERACPLLPQGADSPSAVGSLGPTLFA